MRLSHERLFNICAGLSVLSWSVIGFADAYADGSIPAVRICICLLHLLVGFLFIFRSPVKINNNIRDLSVVLFSFIGAGLAFASSPLLHEWPDAAILSFVLGSGIAISSLFYLGRSFTILPAQRDIVIRGPYRCLRHPAYTGEIIMIMSCCLAEVWWGSLCALLIVIASIAYRICSEERFLSRDEGYLSYKQQVRWRLLPGVW